MKKTTIIIGIMMLILLSTSIISLGSSKLDAQTGLSAYKLNPAKMPSYTITGETCTLNYMTGATQYCTTCYKAEEEYHCMRTQENDTSKVINDKVKKDISERQRPVFSYIK